MKFYVKYILSLIAFCFASNTFSQNSKQINWISWEQLDEALKEQPKPVLIYFHANWCTYCKKIERKAFNNTAIIKRINRNYYAVEMDVESKDTIIFDGLSFVNSQSKTKRNSVHQLPLLLASRENKAFSLPATLLFDKNFQIKERIFEYYTSKELLSKL